MLRLTGRRLLWYTVGLALVFGSCALALSRAPAGRIERTRGKVVLMRGSARLTAAAGRTLYAGDRLTTGRNAWAIIRLGTHLIKMGPETSMMVKEAAKSNDKYRIRLDLGRLWLLIRKSFPNLDFCVETPAAVAGVRGTFFSVQVQPDGTTWVGVREGSVRVEAAGGEGFVDLSPGFGTTIKPGGGPGTPEKVPPDQVGGDELKEKAKGKPEGGERRDAREFGGNKPG